MATTVYFTSFAKRRNSTAQFLLSGAQSFSCTLKAPTSLQRPTFHISYASYFDFNVACWEGRYYFVDDAVSVGEGRWEVTLVVDVLATYKSWITSSSFFVAYCTDESLRNVDLADLRIPTKLQPTITEKKVNTYLDSVGCYVLTVNSEQGCKTYKCDSSQIEALLQNISSWALSQITDFDTAPASGGSYNWTSGTEIALQSLGKMLNQSSFLGNAYADAPNNIKSCVWIPYTPSGSSPENIFLGQYHTGVTAYPILTLSDYYTQDIEIGGVIAGWEKAVNRTLMLYLPFVGVIDLPAPTLANYTHISVDMNISCVDGQLTYVVYAGKTSDITRKLIGIYGGTCGSTIALGYSQQASFGNIAQTAYKGVESMVAQTVNSSPSPVSIVGSAVGVALEGMKTTYEIKDVQATYANGCIGNFSGLSNRQLPLEYKLITYDRETIVDKLVFENELGYPVQTIVSLSTITGYVQCVNAHLAMPGDAGELDAIDFYLNSGFYIE